ncbi:MAG: DUF924 family protein [Betaproteobacteria bacterium]
MSSEALLEYWFGTDVDDSVVASTKAGLWWKSDPAVDDDLRKRFADLVEKAGRNELGEWASTPRGLLALILLSDQLPRNIHRNTPRAFAFDSIARAHCRDGIALGFDTRLRPIERVFHYLPLEHSESLADQDDSVRLFSDLAHDAGPETKELFAGYQRFAERHHEIIERLGRFPHRNRILGRVSTAEEIAFLQTPGSSF